MVFISQPIEVFFGVGAVALSLLFGAYLRNHNSPLLGGCERDTCGRGAGCGDGKSVGASATRVVPRSRAPEWTGVNNGGGERSSWRRASRIVPASRLLPFCRR